MSSFNGYRVAGHAQIPKNTKYDLLHQKFGTKFALYLPLVAFLLSVSAVHGDQYWSGGSNQWDVGTTADWSGATWGESYDPTTGIVSNPGDQANFTATGGTVTVSNTATSAVATNELFFQNGDNTAYDLTGDTIYTDNSYNGTMIEVAGGSGPVTIDSNISQINGNATTYAANSFPGDNQHINNDSSSDLTLNGTLDYENQTTLFTAANGTGKIIFNGTINATTSGLYTLGGGTYEFTANSNMTALDSAHNGSNLSLVEAGGTVILDADTFLSTSNFQILGGNGIYLNGAFTGTQDMTDERASGLLGGLQAVQSGWTGAIYLDNGPATQTFSQVAGGRFTYASTDNGGLHGTNLTYMITSGGGTVVLGASNSYGIYSTNATDSHGNPYTLAADLQAHQTLIKNSSGSAFGNNTGIVQVEAGKLLGGNGTSTQKVVAMDASSIIAPGDPGDSNLGIAASVGQLNLIGGLQSAANGLTMDFKLNGGVGVPNPGTDNDSIYLSDLTLTGTVTINFTNLGGVDTDAPYTIISGGGDWTAGSDLKFVINTPAGFALDDTYGDTDPTDPTKDLGYSLDLGGDSFTVKFVAIPEPSTYAMMLGGLALLGFCLRRRAALIG